MSAVAHIDEYKQGTFYTEEFRGTSSWNGYENNMLLRNDTPSGGALRFTEVAMAAGADDVYDARGIAVADFDRDGDLDLAVSHNPGDDAMHVARAVLYRNDLADGLSSIAFELEGTESNREALGAEVGVRVGTRWMTRLREAGSGYASQHSARLHFGVRELAPGETVDAVEVRWPSGRVDAFGPLEVGRVYRLVEGQGEGEGAEPLEPAVPARLGGS
ncbi:MAG: CRTAC1 family protein [Acidobacteriota bacterium]